MPLPINVIKGGLEVVNVIVNLTDVSGGCKGVSTTTMTPEGIVSTVRILEHPVPIPMP